MVFLKFLYRVYFDIKSKIELILFAIRWSTLNKHNHTTITRIFPIECVEVGNHSYGDLNIYSYNNGINEKLLIGNYVSIANDVKFILGGNHNSDTLTSYPLKTFLKGEKFQDSFSKGPIIVEDEVWLGNGAMVLSGVRIGKGAIVAAGAIVTKDIPPFAIVAGAPAKIIRFRYAPEVIEILDDFSLADISQQNVIRNIHLFYQKVDHSNLKEMLNLLNSK